MTEGLEWKVKQVRDSVDPASKHYNPRSAKAKLVTKLEKGSTTYGLAKVGELDTQATQENLAHPNDDM